MYLAWLLMCFLSRQSVTFFSSSVCCSEEPASVGVHLRDFDEPYVQPTVP